MRSLIQPESEFPAAPSRDPFAFRDYQKEDLARSAIHDGAVLAWDPGLGKTMAIFAWPYLKNSRRTLIVAPAALHDQIIKEGREKFGETVIPIPDQDAAIALMRSGKLPFPGSTMDRFVKHSNHLPEYFITDYRWLGYNGGDEWAAGESGDDEFPVTDIQRRRRMAVIARHFGMSDYTLARAEALVSGRKAATAHAILGVPADAPRSVVKQAYRELARLTHPDLHPEDPTATARMQRLNNALEAMLKGDASTIVKGIDDEVLEARPTIAQLMAGIGHVIEGIRCVFTPTLSTLLADCFDCVVADEAVRLKSGDTYIASGVLKMRPKYRLALTGTPIKNCLPDVFFLGSWACGSNDEATARWPYGNTKANQSAFASHHLVMEENLTKEQKSRDAGQFRRYIKRTNKLTNIHRLWKLLGPVVVRRRKDHIGGSMVNKIVHPIRVMPGTEQQRTYKWHIDNPPVCATPVASIGAQLQCLRQAALCPWSASLSRPGKPHSKSPSKWSPKMIAILNLAADLMANGEQLVVFSPFQEFSTSLKDAMTEAGVPALLLDGRVKNTRRGELAGEFKQGKYPVLIAGIDAMGEGHSFECASHLVIPSLSWAYDANRQAIERVHRLTSRKDVTIYVMITTNSVDERLFAIFGEKGDSSDLALDGRLFEEDKREVSLADLIRSATLEFDPKAQTLAESDLAAEWDTHLRSRLASASKQFIMQRGTAAAVSLARPAHAPQPARTLPRPAAAITAPVQPTFFMDTPAETTPAETTPAETAAATIEVDPTPENIIEFPAPASGRLRKLDSIKHLLNALD